MLLKGVVVGDKLVLNWLSLQSSEADPAQLELDIHKFTTSSEGNTTLSHHQCLHVQRRIQAEHLLIFCSRAGVLSTPC